jgi:hypothetical protein
MERRAAPLGMLEACAVQEHTQSVCFRSVIRYYQDLASTEQRQLQAL